MELIKVAVVLLVIVAVTEARRFNYRQQEGPKDNKPDKKPDKKPDDRPDNKPNTNVELGQLAEDSDVLKQALDSFRNFLDDKPNHPTEFKVLADIVKQNSDVLGGAVNRAFFDLDDLTVAIFMARGSQLTACSSLARYLNRQKEAGEVPTDADKIEKLIGDSNCLLDLLQLARSEMDKLWQDFANNALDFGDLIQAVVNLMDLHHAVEHVQHVINNGGDQGDASSAQTDGGQSSPESKEDDNKDSAKKQLARSLLNLLLKEKQSHK